jgi:hypothetical protein
MQIIPKLFHYSNSIPQEKLIPKHLSLECIYSIWQPCAGILEQSMGARNRVGIGLSYRPPEPVFVNIYGAQESIPPAYVALRASTTKRVVVDSSAP